LTSVNLGIERGELLANLREHRAAVTRDSHVRESLI